MEQLKNQLIKEWGNCLVDRPISLTPDDRRLYKVNIGLPLRKGQHIWTLFLFIIHLPTKKLMLALSRIFLMRKHLFVMLMYELYIMLGSG